MDRGIALAIGGWLVAAVAATATGLAAVQIIGTGLTGGPAGAVRDEDEVARLLAEGPPPAVGPGPTPVVSATGGDDPPAPQPQGTPATGATTPTRRVLATPGGTVVAQCEAKGVRLVSWAPAQGYGTEDIDHGPDDDVEVTFEGSGDSIEVTVRCEAGLPTVTWEKKD